MHPPVPVVPASPSSRVARIIRARHREYKMTQSGTPIPSIDDGDQRKHKRKLLFPFSLKRLAKQVYESPSPRNTPKQPSSPISPRIRKAISPPDNFNGTSFVHSPSSPETPTRRRHHCGRSRMQSRRSMSPRLFLQKNEQFDFGASMQEKMEPLLPVVEAIYPGLQTHRPPLTSRFSSKRKREDEEDSVLESRPASRVCVEL